ncbi:MAG TPA: hypothetical protein PKE59_00055 [Novosphingobium sp.]|jgi:hypothetical protein|nr:hypothetical protein [Novosphingobium sp.]
MATDKMNFIQLLQATRRGEIVREADDLLAEMVRAIHEHGGKGDLTLKLSVKKNDAEQLEITPTLNMKKPRRALGIGIAYATGEGELSRTDPQQDDLFDELEDRRSSRDVN